jgi:DNA-binding winged helix-turn-helix (wHTH) protein
MSSDDQVREDVRFGSAMFSEVRMELRVKQLPVDIERRPLEVLSALVRGGGRVVSKSELLETVWPDDPDVTEGVITTAVRRLRLGLTPENRMFIVTVRTVRGREGGYRFTGVDPSVSGNPCPICGRC